MADEMLTNALAALSSKQGQGIMAPAPQLSPGNQFLRAIIPTAAMAAGALMSSPAGTNRTQQIGRGLLGGLTGYAMSGEQPYDEKQAYYAQKLESMKRAQEEFDLKTSRRDTFRQTLTPDQQKQFDVDPDGFLKRDFAQKNMEGTYKYLEEIGFKNPRDITDPDLLHTAAQVAVGEHLRSKNKKVDLELKSVWDKDTKTNVWKVWNPETGAFTRTVGEYPHERTENSAVLTPYQARRSIDSAQTLFARYLADPVNSPDLTGRAHPTFQEWYIQRYGESPAYLYELAKQGTVGGEGTVRKPAEAPTGPAPGLVYE